MVVASANYGQDPQWHYTQCGSAVLVMFTACGDGCAADHRTTQVKLTGYIIIQDKTTAIYNRPS